MNPRLHAMAALMLALCLAQAARAAAPECRLSPECPAEGRCTADGATCVIGGPADCFGSDLCQRDGECMYDPATKRCTPFPKETRGCPQTPCWPDTRARGKPLRIPGGGCRETPACRTFGLCQLPPWHQGNESCITSSAADCKASLGCKIFGQCNMGKDFACGAVVAGEPREDGGSCRLGRMCKLFGDCVMTDPLEGATCVEGPADADRSVFCKRSGRCALPPSDATCAKSDLCRVLGRCAGPAPSTTWSLKQEAPGCVAKDCSQSEVCVKYGACYLADGRCVHPPEERAPCDLEEITPLTATASSAQADWKTYTFGAQNLVDRDLGTSWQPAPKSPDGAYFEVTLPRSVHLAEIHIANGFQRRDAMGDLQRLNGMLGHALVAAGDVRRVVELQYDRTPQGAYYGWTVLTLPRIAASSFRVTALSVTPGLLWDDLAVSEVRVFACREAPPSPR